MGTARKKTLTLRKPRRRRITAQEADAVIASLFAGKGETHHPIATSDDTPTTTDTDKETR